MIILFPKLGYNKDSELYWSSYVHFKFGGTFKASSLWRRTLSSHFSRHLLHIHQFQHSRIRLGFFGDIPSHPRLCRHLLLYQQSTSSYGSTTQYSCHWNTFARPHTVSIIVGHKNYRVSLSLDICLSWLWVIHKSTLHRSLFARPHNVSIIVSHKNYRVSLSLDVCLSWLWVIHKPTLHRSPFAWPHTINITAGHKNYRISLSSAIHSSWLWVNHTKPFSSVALHIQQRLLRRELHAMGTIASWGGRNDLKGKWHPPMVFIHP